MRKIFRVAREPRVLRDWYLIKQLRVVALSSSTRILPLSLRRKAAAKPYRKDHSFIPGDAYHRMRVSRGPRIVLRAQLERKKPPCGIRGRRGRHLERRDSDYVGWPLIDRPALTVISHAKLSGRNRNKVK